MVVFIMLYKVVLTSESSDEILIQKKAVKPHFPLILLKRVIT